jgi:hypothetical protein
VSQSVCQRIAHWPYQGLLVFPLLMHCVSKYSLLNYPNWWMLMLSWVELPALTPTVVSLIPCIFQYQFRSQRKWMDHWDANKGTLCGGQLAQHIELETKFQNELLNQLVSSIYMCIAERPPKSLLGGSEISMYLYLRRWGSNILWAILIRLWLVHQNGRPPKYMGFRVLWLSRVLGF